jgi:hypothetical protein
MEQWNNKTKKKGKDSPVNMALEANRVLRCRGSHIF